MIGVDEEDCRWEPEEVDDEGGIEGDEDEDKDADADEEGRIEVVDNEGEGEEIDAGFLSTVNFTARSAKNIRY